MATSITCPNCNTEFEASAALEQSIHEKLRGEFNQKWLEQKKIQDEAVKTQEAALRRQEAQLAAEMQKLLATQKQAAEEINRKVAAACKEQELQLKAQLVEKEKELAEKVKASSATQLKFLEEQAAQQKEELEQSRKKELDFLRKMEEAERREKAQELELQRQIMAERQKLSEELKKSEEERYRLRDEENKMRMKEYEKQLEDQKKLIEEMKRKAEQGSMQLQGEVQELALEELLRAAFPFDMIKEVPKGIRGGDCILTVRNNFMQECGCIIFESKRTQAFGSDWIEKLKGDMLGCNAELAVIVTQVLPKDMDRFGERQGVYVCNFSEVKSLVGVLRQAIIKIFEARKSQENKGDKMVMLYDYLTGSEFMGQWNAMREAFSTFRQQLQKERDDFERNWKKKEKLLQVIVNNSLQISGSIEGISGMESMNWSALPEENGYVLE